MEQPNKFSLNEIVDMAAQNESMTFEDLTGAVLLHDLNITELQKSITDYIEQLDSIKAELELCKDYTVRIRDDLLQTIRIIKPIAEEHEGRSEKFCDFFDDLTIWKTGVDEALSQKDTQITALETRSEECCVERNQFGENQEELKVQRELDKQFLDSATRDQRILARQIEKVLSSFSEDLRTQYIGLEKQGVFMREYLMRRRKLMGLWGRVGRFLMVAKAKMMAIIRNCLLYFDGYYWSRQYH